MKYILAVALCFVFTSLVAGQGYGRRRTPIRKPILHPKPQIPTNRFIHPKPVIPKKPVAHPKPVVPHPKPIMADPWTMGSPINGGVMPKEILDIIGSTFNGQEFIGGVSEGFPLHGGAGPNAVDGLRGNWGADPNAPRVPAVSNWEDPWNNAAFPANFQGEEVVFDPVQNQFNLRHQQAKETQHMRVKNGGLVPVRPLGQTSIQAEHNIVKEANHIARKTIGGISPVVGPVVNPVGHHVEKQIVGQQMHHAAKSSGIIKAGKPSYLRRGQMNVGGIGHHNPAINGFIHQNGHVAQKVNQNIAKSSGISSAGFNNHNTQKMRHNIVKSTGGSMLGKPIGGGYVGLSQINTGIVHRHQTEKVKHNIVKSSMGGVGQIGGAHQGHNIVKSSMGGVGQIGGAHQGHNIVKSSMGGVGPMGGAHQGHNIVKSSMGGVGPMGGAHQGHNIVKSSMGGVSPKGGAHQGHNIVKSSMGGVGPMGGVHHGHNIAKSSMGRVGAMGGVHHGHNIAKSSMGGVRPMGGAQHGHNTVKASMGGVGPMGGTQHGHNIVKASMRGVGPMGGAQHGHNIVKSSMGGIGPMNGAHNGHNIVKSQMGGVVPLRGNGHFGAFQEDPVDSVHNVIKTGIASQGHDQLARHIGENMATTIIRESAGAVNVGSNGAVSRGNPVAIAATHGLAKESIHVAGKTLNAASQSNPIRPNGPIAVGNNVFGSIHPKPIHPKPVVKIPRRKVSAGGYGRRRY